MTNFRRRLSRCRAVGPKEGARLTPLGHQVLGAFRKLERLVRIDGRSELQVIGRSAGKHLATGMAARR